MSQAGQFILCIDDDSDDLYFLQEAIREVDPNMDIVQFNSGIDALQYLKEAKTEHDLPCVAILDINMPVMDGKETLNRIKADPGLAHVHVVVLTTSSSKKDFEYFRELGIKMFTKPVKAEDFRQIAEIFVQHCK